MNIIEKEIERREKLISDNSEKIERIAKLTAEADELQKEVIAFDEAVIRVEIEELKTYLVSEETVDSTNPFGINLA